MVKTDTGTVLVQVAPAEFLKEMDTSFKKGDQIEVVGAKNIGTVKAKRFWREKLPSATTPRPCETIAEFPSGWVGRRPRSSRLAIRNWRLSGDQALAEGLRVRARCAIVPGNLYFSTRSNSSGRGIHGNPQLGVILAGAVNDVPQQHDSSRYPNPTRRTRAAWDPSCVSLLPPFFSATS